MKNCQFVVGIDVSKKTLDICLLVLFNAADCHYYHTTNSLKGYLRLLTWLKARKVSLKEGLFLLEHTGIYSLIVCLFLKKQSLNYSLIPGVVLKKSLGICRGKSDKKDAYAIARYGYLYREDINLQILKEDQILKLQILFSQRKRFVSALKALLSPVKEMEEMGMEDLAKQAIQNQQIVVAELKTAIKKAETQMLNLIEEDVELNKQYNLCTSIPGVGMQLATYLLIVTHAFSRFSDSRKLASYAGVAPFPYQSGTSIKGKNKTSPMGDKALKALLHMGALNVIQHDNQIKIYYTRKRAEGKNAMLVLNAVKNKLLARVLATVNRGTPFVQLAQHIS